MDKIYLGVNTETQRCCIIKTDGITSKMSATDWNGSDDIDRTCRLENFAITDNKQKYDGEYCGVDNDMRHEYPFYFKFDELWEVVKRG